MTDQRKGHTVISLNNSRQKVQDAVIKWSNIYTSKGKKKKNLLRWSKIITTKAFRECRPPPSCWFPHTLWVKTLIQSTTKIESSVPCPIPENFIHYFSNVFANQLIGGNNQVCVCNWTGYTDCWCQRCWLVDNYQKHLLVISIESHSLYFRTLMYNRKRLSCVTFRHVCFINNLHSCHSCVWQHAVPTHQLICQWQQKYSFNP